MTRVSPIALALLGWFMALHVAAHGIYGVLTWDDAAALGDVALVALAVVRL